MKNSFLRFSSDNIDQAARLLFKGALLLYPTETFYALGCPIGNISSIQAIFKIKQRSTEKTFPLLAANMTQANMAVDCAAAPPELEKKFWPGPLTLILPARLTLPRILQNSQRKAAIRISSNLVAQKLALLCACPLVATSANIAGNTPPRSVDEIDENLYKALAMSKRPWAVIENDQPCSKTKSLPSTIIEPEKTASGDWLLHILREGAIDRNVLKKENFTVS